jgi:hypothetical protein
MKSRSHKDSWDHPSSRETGGSISESSRNQTSKDLQGAEGKL